MSEHTPDYIRLLPWYAKKEGTMGIVTASPATKVQRQSLTEWYDRGKRGFQATTFRKGSCENCGAMGHARKDCTERPRLVPAKFKQQNIAPDDVIKDVALDWEAKQDRWNGYETEMYNEVVEDFKQYEQIRKRKKLDEGAHDLDEEFKPVHDPVALANLPSKSDKNVQKFQGLGGVRNREDTAKYLRDLTDAGATFDPKSRSLRGEYNYAELLDKGLLGEKKELEELQQFALKQVIENHAQISTSALPTLTEKISKSMKQRNDHILSGKLGEIMVRYGAEPTQKKGLDTVYEETDIVQLPQALKRVSANSRYAQDIHINDHTSVWGSWYNRYLGWGYACCYGTEKQSFCLGERGKQKALIRQMKKQAQILKEQGLVEQLEKEAEAQLKGHSQSQEQAGIVEDNKEASTTPKDTFVTRPVQK